MTPLHIPTILLPRTVTPEWITIACDQYTSQPEVWEETARLVGDAPSTYHFILPEVWLDDADARIPGIHAAMQEALAHDLTRSIHGFVLTARATQSGCRRGLVLAVDLEDYDYSVGSTSPVRATEGTILSRIPPRQKVRRGAPLETPHIMLLLDDPDRTVIEPLFDRLSALESVYDLDLHQSMGHLSGWAVTAQEDIRAIQAALEALDARRGDAPLFAVGDGNHSLATAKACWEELKAQGASADHPARYALVEVVNLYDEALAFEPIHRVLTNIDVDHLADILKKHTKEDGANPITLVTAQREETFRGLPIHVLQPLLDRYLQSVPGADIDYVHGDEAARELGQRPNSCALLLTTLDKLQLFPAVAHGPLPRKAFSMGEANEKRCYCECRRIVP